MKLQTQIPLEKKSDHRIDYNSNICLLGSCFVENIGEKLEYYKFQNTINPFGILFHPKAIETLILKAVQKKQYTEANVFFHNEQWHCFDAHSQLSNGSKEVLISNLNTQLQNTRQHLKEASHIVITLGTAWVYKHYKSNLPVANCHKVSQQDFKKELLSIKEITDSLQTLLYKIRDINATASVIFTVSPIRHIKDGFVENTRGKAHLIAALQGLLSTNDGSKYFYFPSYEIMMDELRDYRFYAEDMLHPNDTAITYIWEKFQTVWMSPEALSTMDEVDTIQKGLAHKSFNPESEAHAKFLKQLEARIDKLQTKFPHIIF